VFTFPNLASNGFFRMGQFIGVSEICPKPTPVTTVTKIWKFEYKIIISQLACDAVPYTHDCETANINVKKLISLKLSVRTTW